MQHKKTHFKYHPNIYNLDIFHEATEGEYSICQCCGQETKFSYQTMYCRDNVDYLCPECIASGEAAKKFNGEFAQAAEDFKVNDESKRDELYCRTPGYISWQGENWLACCEDYCAYIGEVGTKELEEMGIADVD